MAPRSMIWKYYKIKGISNEQAECRLCNASGTPTTLIRGKSPKLYSTKPLWNHLKSKHPNEYKANDSETSQSEIEEEYLKPSTSAQPTLLQTISAAKMWSINDSKSLTISRKIGKLAKFLELQVTTYKTKFI